MFPSRSHHVDKPGHYRLLFMIIAHKCFINGTTLVHVIDKLVGKYIMEQCDMDFCCNLYIQILLI